MDYNNIILEINNKISYITINRPNQLNSLNSETIKELNHAITISEENKNTRCILLTGRGTKAFVAGADIKEMQDKTWTEAYMEDFITAGWERLSRCRKPVIAAVSGFALGGGCEIAMMCDFIIAADTAKFGQPEINLGVIPGFGGTQRLARRIGLPLARELIYTGDMIDAETALRYGLANRVVPLADCLAEAKALAHKLTTKPPIAIQQAKAAINAGIDMDIINGCRFETEAFGLTFATQDKAEGMSAFLEKRAAQFSGK